jgi:3-hydroxyisobutyrate dehydrogenase-like beta-hydroxyacid dehydrogenase
MIRNVAIISPGDMGHSVGQVLLKSGFNVMTCLEGRSARTKNLAYSAQFQIVDNYNDLIDGADLLLSILPPDSADELVDNIAAILKSDKEKNIYFVDCNAISPFKSISLASKINNAGGTFIDGGIIGKSPDRGDIPRFYVSGPEANIMRALDGCGISVRVMGNKIGQASAIKMCYAALTKGTNTLYIALLLAAHKMDVLDPLKNELQSSQKNHYGSMEKNLSSIPANAHRWVGEMKEISQTFEKLGITPLFHEGSEEIYKFLLKSSFAEETPETIDLDRTVWEMIDSLGDL